MSKEKITDKTYRDENTQQNNNDIETCKRTTEELDEHCHASSKRHFQYIFVKIFSKNEYCSRCMTEDEYRSFINTLADIENTHTDRNAETFTIEGTIFRLEKIPDTINEYMLIDDIKYTCTRTVSPDVIKNNLPKYCKRSW